MDCTYVEAREREREERQQLMESYRDSHARYNQLIEDNNDFLHEIEVKYYKNRNESESTIIDSVHEIRNIFELLSKIEAVDSLFPDNNKERIQSAIEKVDELAKLIASYSGNV